MKARTVGYSVYMVLSIIISLSVALIPSVLLFFVFFEKTDIIVNGFGWPFVPIQTWFESTFSWLLPSFIFPRFWFLIFFVPIFFICYGLFLGLLTGMFLLSRKGLPYIEDGTYPMETEEWLIYEYSEIYYNLYPYFAWFFTLFLNTRPRHVLFGAKIGKNTVVGNGLLFNPERTIIGDNCFFGYDAVLTGHVYEKDELFISSVKVGNNVTIGTNCIIFPGAEIGDNVVIAANAIVPKNRVVPSNTIYIHGKAIPRKGLVEDGEIISDDTVPDDDFESTPEEQ